MKIHHLLMLLLFFSCRNESSNKRGYTDADMEFEDLLEIPSTEQPAPSNGATANDEVTKKVIKTGGIDFQSKSIEEDYKKIHGLLPKFNAYIENENQTKSTQRLHYSLTIRVPSAVYDTLYTSLSTLGLRLESRYSNVEDVTGRYYDLKTRIKNKKALEERYLELLKKAYDITDILEIEKNLNAVRTEIERLQGQFNYLSKQVNFSTINLSFYEILPYVYDSTQREGFGSRILSAMDNGWQGFLSFLVGLTSLWPFVIIVIGGIYLFRKVRRKWKNKNF